MSLACASVAVTVGCSMQLAEYWNSQQLLLHHLMAMSALIKHQITRPYGYFCTFHAKKTEHLQFPLVCTQQIPADNYVFTAPFLIS
jgi:hypothetical protein